jgi:long-chain acyl-CoA synthetase
MMVAVPRIFEKVYAAIYAQVGNNPVTSKLFKWAVEIGKKAGEYRLQHKSVPIDLFLQYQLADRLVLKKVREAFGGRLRFAISGGAPMASDIALFFHACGVLVLEGYGLTETTAAICVNTPFNYRFGSVGTPIGDVQLKIAEDGEILVKSKKVMKEYYLDPEATKEAFTDGWYHTGDIGEILTSGDLKITDRKKDLIKTAGGKYVAPQRLENLLKMNSFIANVLIHGDQKKYIVALITLDKPSILQFAKDKNISFKDYESLTQHPAVLELVRRGVAEANSHLASYETIKRFSVLTRDFTVEDGELTPSLKVKRKVLDKKFANQLEALYS